MPSVDDLVKSDIVFDSKLSPSEQTTILTRKYILRGCELEVNISYRCRLRLTQMLESTRFDSMTDCELCIVFDTVIEELYNLMSDSFSRF